MAKVIAVFEVVRPGEIIKPGAVFTATGDDLEYLMKVGAVRKPTKEDGVTELGEETGTGSEKPVAQTEAEKVAASAAKSPATTSKASTTKAPAKGSKSDNDGI